MAEEKTDSGKKRHRSPNYPAVGLRAAVERVRALYEKDGRPGAPLETAVQHFGYSSAHGQAMTTVSALKKFGLIEDRNNRIVPTELAVQILEYPPSKQRHADALQEAVLKPEIYAELVEQYRQHGRLPSDESLRPELITDKGFNPKAVDGFLKDFRDSLEYAGLLEGNTLKLSSAATSDTDEGAEGMTETREKTEQQRQPPKGTGPYIRFPLSATNTVEISVTERMSIDDFIKIQQLIELSKSAFVDPTKNPTNS
jgi:hypothetical protein